MSRRIFSEGEYFNISGKGIFSRSLKHAKNVRQLPLSDILLSQRYKDSNLEMTESESVALPFGDSPIFCLLATFWYYTRFFFSLQVLFFIFFNSYFSAFCSPLQSPQKRQKPAPPSRMAKVPDYQAGILEALFYIFPCP